MTRKTTATRAKPMWALRQNMPTVPPMHPKYWTPERVQQLRELYPDNPTDVVAKQIGRTVKSIYHKANALGLHKSAVFWASDASGRIQRGCKDDRMKVTQFQPGLTPWNKGIKSSTGLHPNCRATQFKPGRTPEQSRNYVPIGTLRLNHDKHLERKATDDPTLVPARRWQPVYRLVWEAAHGPIPKGSMVVFKRGQTTNVLEQITLDRLECITRAENARRNSVHRHSPEMSQLYQLKGAISRQVNRIKKHTQEATAP